MAPLTPPVSNRVRVHTLAPQGWTLFRFSELELGQEGANNIDQQPHSLFPASFIQLPLPVFTGVLPFFGVVESAAKEATAYRWDLLVD
mmetsp:Transcript_60369/g.88405  ORF Transcript_60369/g.88405 Transcript_60369/m.88405 type:complete len:88 (-) Transcript_60369:661-924(-)